MNRYIAREKALEKAAKYICNLKCGLCPMVEEGFECPGTCSLEVLPWQCWLAFFIRLAETGQQDSGPERAKAA